MICDVFVLLAGAPSPRRLPDAALAMSIVICVGGLLAIRAMPARAASRRRRCRGVTCRRWSRSREHVVTRAFYLLRSFPGRSQSAQLWAESASAASSRDGVAAIFIGDGDWASAWSGQAGVSDRQREMSLRFGVNMVMVALTGNYKADQVHVPALLERMGGERR
jgi:hypothetical protein